MKLGQTFVKYFICSWGNGASRKNAFEIYRPLFKVLLIFNSECQFVLLMVAIPVAERKMFANHFPFQKKKKHVKNGSKESIGKILSQLRTQEFASNTLLLKHLFPKLKVS